MLNNIPVFYGGLPRSGSHLFSAIVGENPKIHSEGTSALCRILWEIKNVFESDLVSEELVLSNRNDSFFNKNIYSSIFNSYYQGQNNKIVLEKNRSWTLKENLNLIDKFIDKDQQKFIIMTRDIEECSKSFISLAMNNGYSQQDAEEIILNLSGYGKNPFMRPVAATVWAKVIKNNNFLFIDYKDLINNTENILVKFYDFLDIDYFKHDLNNINAIYHEKSSLRGLSEVRNTISTRQTNINLSLEATNKILKIMDVFDMADYPEKYLKEINNFYNENIF